MINLTADTLSAIGGAPTVPAPDDVGWCLYGVIRCSGVTDPLRQFDHADPDAEARLRHVLNGEPVRLIHKGSLAAGGGEGRPGGFTARGLQGRPSAPLSL